MTYFIVLKKFHLHNMNVREEFQKGMIYPESTLDNFTFGSKDRTDKLRYLRVNGYVGPCNDITDIIKALLFKDQ